MTTTYDPLDPAYLDEPDVREELARVFAVCDGCRRCHDLCATFPTLFHLLEGFEDRDPGRMTPAQQDEVVASCLHCTMCATGCPYAPGRHEQQVDVPRLMLRAVAMNRERGHIEQRVRRADTLLSRSDARGRVATRAPSTANRVFAAKPGSVIRRVIRLGTGVSAVRLLPPFARERFSTWFSRRPLVTLGRRQASVTVFPTCLVEYHEPRVGQDLIRVYERNGIQCDVSSAQCCGAPLLHTGDLQKFAERARSTVQTLADEARSGNDIVVPQPTCASVIRDEYPLHAPGPDADLVRDRTFDASEYLMRVHRGERTRLDMSFLGHVPDAVTYHASCHVRARQTGFPSRDLLKLTGADVTVVQQCSGSGGGRGFRDGDDTTAQERAESLAVEMTSAGVDAFSGDCHIANVAIEEQTSRRPSHPMQLLARAYGIPEEPDLHL